MKTFDITFDVKKPTDPQNTLWFFSGDAVKLNFTLKDGQTTRELADNEELIVFAARNWGAQPYPKGATVFRGTSTNMTVEFSSGETSRARRGNHFLCAAIFDGTNLAIWGAAHLVIVESGYDGFSEDTPPPFVLADALAQEVIASISAAKNEIDGITEEAAEIAGEIRGISENIAESVELVRGYKNESSENAQKAATDKDAVSKIKTSVENTKSAIDEKSAQVAADRAAAEAAAGTAVNSSDLAALCRRAANVGFYDFDTGKLAFDKPGIIAAPPFSLCITYDVDSWAGLGNAPMGGLAFFNNHCVIWTDPYQKGGFHLCYEEAGRLFFACGNLDAAPATREFKATINKPLPVGRHTLVVCVLESLASLGAAAVRCYVDGLYFGDMSLSYNKLSGDDISSTFPFQINTIANYASSTVASCPIDTRLSRVKIFNFDMTAEGAPYKVADYAAGIDPSPALTQGVITTTAPTMGASAGDGWNIESAPSANVVNGDWTAGTKCVYCKNAALSETDIAKIGTSYAIDLNTGTADSHPQQMLFWNASKFAKFQGRTVRACISFWIRNNSTYTGSGSSLGVSVLLGIGWNYTQIYRINVGTSTLPTGEWRRIDEEITVGPLDYADNYLGLGAASGAGTFEGAPYTIADFKFEIIGANLALSDAADASQIRDESSNGNHAIMSGEVLASKNNNPAHCSQTISWAGASTLQNVCGDAAIPANSKVTAYAKATGAVTASFKAGSNTAQSKDLAANTLMEIGSWLCGAAGAFSVQPSAAYTGSIETYLIIERL